MTHVDVLILLSVSKNARHNFEVMLMTDSQVKPCVGLTGAASAVTLQVTLYH